VVLEQVRRVVGQRAAGLTLDSPIADLGLDSIERMEVLASLEDRFGGRFPEEVLPRLTTCRQVVEAVDHYLGTDPRPAVNPPAHGRRGQGSILVAGRNGGIGRLRRCPARLGHCAPRWRA
jgi:acyl carrier protein